MNREELKPCMMAILDDAGGGVVDFFKQESASVAEHLKTTDDCWLFGWQSLIGDWLYVVAVRSYLPDTRLSYAEAVEIALDWMIEKGFLETDNLGQAPEPIYQIQPVL